MSYFVHGPVGAGFLPLVQSHFFCSFLLPGAAAKPRHKSAFSLVLHLHLLLLYICLFSGLFVFVQQFIFWMLDLSKHLFTQEDRAEETGEIKLESWRLSNRFYLLNQGTRSPDQNCRQNWELEDSTSPVEPQQGS